MRTGTGGKAGRGGSQAVDGYPRHRLLQFSNKMLSKGFCGNVLSLCVLSLHSEIDGSSINVDIVGAKLCKYLPNEHHFRLGASNKEVCFFAMGYPPKPVVDVTCLDKVRLPMLRRLSRKIKAREEEAAQVANLLFPMECPPIMLEGTITALMWACDSLESFGYAQLAIHRLLKIMKVQAVVEVVGEEGGHFLGVAKRLERADLGLEVIDRRRAGVRERRRLSEDDGGVGTECVGSSSWGLWSGGVAPSDDGETEAWNAAGGAKDEEQGPMLGSGMQAYTKLIMLGFPL
ncbi:hypothetical protein AK812_SmicGene42301 [Symbiodinium microadriaticum]|uniref:Uncharacterized protein n=1 Tax=Symbiodinium microadriaticum TaxID=2951 RepID=A0A1Q9C3X6_SYMMI|nr:hypothetical protein AK812_SmicGene42301 [Symbiodinium microadriaticum]